ncbi:putative RNA-directed DNA polymerase from transposon BS [Araneus ventricosus]|uniref:Putative RNA-directed DNA polymerase from transposon BS n=1 Tax=Araneus ventricosus TaxID=182803 RepID=A0A4Y2Q4L3_ARAVE|nr:putative RNA-directed DNA polymerase from transposon BS [Araneus ventricosus]
MLHWGGLILTGWDSPLRLSALNRRNDDPRPSLQQEIIETELNSESSTYASVAQTSSAIPEGPDTTVNDITNFLAPPNLKFLQCHRLKTKYQSYASFHIDVYENDLKQLLDSTVSPEGCLIAEFYGKLSNDQISQENVRGLRTKTVEFFSSVASVEYDVICVTETWLCEDIDSWHLFDDRYLVYRKDRGSSSNSSRRGGGVLVAIKKCLSSRKLDVPGLDLEAIWISVKLNYSKNMLLCVVYFPPSSHVDNSVFKPSTDLDGNDECRSDCVGDLVKIENVTYVDVVLAIKQLKSSLNVGVDNIPSSFIKGRAELFIYPLLVLFNLSLKTKVFPEVWKQTRIIPVFKKGDAQNCENYRPIAILSPFSEIFESIIHKKLYNQVKNLIFTSQHGFIPKRSTTNNLFYFTDKIISSFESGSQLDVIYIDFSKAFDSIDFGILLKKLHGIGFHINLIDWLLSYLCKRSLYVYFNNAVSHEFTSTSGVPEGSNFGPLLFILFINDLNCVFKYSECLLFADDLKLFGSIRSDLDSVIYKDILIVFLSGA